MNLTDINYIKKLCQQHNIRPKESRGQNFLVSQEYLDKIINAADLKKDDVVLEVGAGFGVLTLELAKGVKKVIAVELDKKLFNILQKNLKGEKNIEVINADILSLPAHQPAPYNPRKGAWPQRGFTPFGIYSGLASLPADYKIVANLPYNITSAFLRKFLSQSRILSRHRGRGLREVGNLSKPKEMILMVQKEVAERICAQPRSINSGQAGQMSLLSVSVQFYAKPKILFYVPRQNFWPQPEVDSAVIKITANGKWLLANGNITEKDFFRIVRIGFSARRKQLQNNLAAGLRIENKKIREVMEKLGFDSKIRAQELSVEDWVRLTDQLVNKRA